ncbi:MAG TPA: SMI1/KNR4 family protein [Gemmata sp.]
MHPERRHWARFRPPATAEQIAEAEAALGLPLPVPLRELYAEFDGLWFGTSGGDVPECEDLDQWTVLPVRLLPVARKELAWLYGPGGPACGDDDPKFLEKLARCVPVALYEGGAAFGFMTDLGAWGIGPDTISSWDHDGGTPHDYGETLTEFLAENATNASQDGTA